MTSSAATRGRRLAEFWAAVAPRLFHDLVEAERLPAADEVALARARAEWDAFSLYACVRGLVAAGGFHADTADAVDAFHAAALERLVAEAGTLEGFDATRATIAERYAEYGAIGQHGGKSGAETVTARLGAAAAGHMTGLSSPPDALAELVGALHETLAEGAAALLGAEPDP